MGERVCVCVCAWWCGLKWVLSGERVVSVRRKLSVCGFNVKDYGFCCKKGGLNHYFSLSCWWCVRSCVCVLSCFHFAPLCIECDKRSGLGGWAALKNKQSAEISCLFLRCVCARARTWFSGAGPATLLTLAIIRSKARPLFLQPRVY